MASLRKKYPSEMPAVDQFHDEVRQLLEIEQVPPSEAHSFMLVVSEAFTNALIHGNAGDPQKQIYVSVLVNESSLRADISDEGTGGLQRVSRRKRPDEESENGRGIDLIKHFADSVSFEEAPGGGLKVSIHFERAKLKQI